MARSSLKNVCRLIKSAQVEIPIEKQFVQDLKRSIELQDNKEVRQPSQFYKPSSLNCIRNCYYQRMGLPCASDSNAVLIGICESGTDRHNRVQEAALHMIENGIDCEYVNVADFVKSRNLDYLEIKSQQGHETKLFHKKLLMSFLCDGIIRYQGRYYILEIKTESIYKWQGRTDVADEHRNQGIAYSEAFGLENVIFLYINRDNCDMKAFMFHVTDEMRTGLRNKIETCEKYVQKKQVPPKPEDVPKKACAYCNYKEQCKMDGE